MSKEIAYQEFKNQYDLTDKGDLLTLEIFAVTVSVGDNIGKDQSVKISSTKCNHLIQW